MHYLAPKFGKIVDKYKQFVANRISEKRFYAKQPIRFFDRMPKPRWLSLSYFNVSSAYGRLARIVLVWVP